MSNRSGIFDFRIFCGQDVAHSSFNMIVSRLLWNVGGRVELVRIIEKANLILLSDLPNLEEALPEKAYVVIVPSHQQIKKDLPENVVMLADRSAFHNAVDFLKNFAVEQQKKTADIVATTS